MWNGSWRRGALLVTAWLLAVAVSPATAQTDQPPADGRRSFNLTPFVAMGDDLAPGAGASIAYPLANWVHLEAEASLDTNAARSGLSLVVNLARFGGVTPYLAGGAGVQRDEVDDGGSGDPWLRTRKKTEFAVGIGGGATMRIGPRWDYRVDFRWYNPKAEWPESWRVYNGLSLRLADRR
jgi:hypothetical protein